jgi:hypothetical protein
MARRSARIAAVALVLVAAATAGMTRAEWRVTAPIPAHDSVAVAVYEGRTPCGAIANEFTGFPAQNCEKIKWQLTFFRDARTGSPSAFLYEGTRTSRRGTWRILRGTPFDADAQVYQLTPLPGGRSLSLLNVDDKVLLLLDGELRPVAGDASWSYAFNRTDRKLPPPK